MEYVAHFVACGFVVLAWILIYRAQKRKTDKYHMEIIEAQKDCAEIIGTFIADAIKSGMSAEK